jgi:diadenylate cyclase
LFLIIPLLIVIIVVTLYSGELKRSIWNKSAHKHGEQKRGVDSIDEEIIENSITEIIKALQDMSKNDVGAIIVLANGNVPPQILNSGVKLDSDISSQLIESVFFPKTPLHDGAMILDGTKIVAAGCFLPLTQQENVPKDMGTRHRAGLGVTESLDVVSIIVSEETGIISVAKAGKIERYADTKLLTKTLENYYWKEIASSKNKGRR